jgi:hypothetical protein
MLYDDVRRRHGDLLLALLAMQATKSFKWKPVGVHPHAASPPRKRKLSPGTLREYVFFLMRLDRVCLLCCCFVPEVRRLHGAGGCQETVVCGRRVTMTKTQGNTCVLVLQGPVSAAMPARMKHHHQHPRQQINQACHCKGRSCHGGSPL